MRVTTNGFRTAMGFAKYLTLFCCDVRDGEDDF